jgi:hypothetical protein
MQKGAKIEANIVNAEETLACHGGQKISFSEGRGIKFATHIKGITGLFNGKG